MNPTDRAPEELAAALFDEAVVPLAEARRAAGTQACFPLGPDPAAPTYFEPPSLSVMAAEDFAFPGNGTPAGLVAALAVFWAAQGESALAAMAPRLAEIAAALAEEGAEGDGRVDILCYTMF